MRPLRKDGRRPRGAPRWRAFVALVSLVVAGLTVLGSAPAQAAAPANDVWDAAAPVALPLKTTLDTTDATTDAVTPPSTDNYVGHSVWYHIQLPKDGPLLLSTRGTSYHHSMRVYHADSATETPDGWELRATGWSGMLVKLRADEHYFLMVATYTYVDSEGVTHVDPGGTLQLRIQRPARVSATLAPVGVLDRVSGAAVVHGTVEASRQVTISLRIELRQLVDGKAVTGGRYKSFTAAAGKTAWKLAVYPDGSFKVGRVRVVSGSARVVELGVRTKTITFGTNVVALR